MSPWSESRAAVARDADARPFHQHRDDPSSLGELEKLRHHFGTGGDVDLGKRKMPRHERFSLLVAMRATPFHIKGNMRRHGLLLARQSPREQRT